VGATLVCKQGIGDEQPGGFGVTDLFNLDVASIPAEGIPAALTALAAVQTALAARLMTPPAPQVTGSDLAEDEMLTVQEVAQRLRRSPKWVYRRCNALPFARRLDNRSWVFSQKGLERWLARQKV
jgi:hypothetical protein